MSVFSVKKSLENLKNQNSWENLLGVPRKYNLNIERVKDRDDWFNFVDTNKFVNYFMAMNNGHKFTTIERHFRTVRQEWRKNLKAKTEG